VGNRIRVFVMIKVVCSRCSYVLYRGENLVSIREVVKKRSLNLRCPRCFKKLNLERFVIEVKPIKRRY